jgi:hypothetical protein
MEKNLIKTWEIEKFFDLRDRTFDLKDIKYNGHLEIILESKSTRLEIIFDRIISFRVLDESFLLQYWEFLNKKKLNGHVFYQIEKSSYIAEISKLSFDFFTVGGGESGIYHYAIFLEDDCIEVLSDLSPEVNIQDRRQENEKM